MPNFWQKDPTLTCAHTHAQPISSFALQNSKLKNGKQAFIWFSIYVFIKQVRKKKIHPFLFPLTPEDVLLLQPLSFSLHGKKIMIWLFLEQARGLHMYSMRATWCPPAGITWETLGWVSWVLQFWFWYYIVPDLVVEYKISERVTCICSNLGPATFVVLLVLAWLVSMATRKERLVSETAALG